MITLFLFLLVACSTMTVTTLIRNHFRLPGVVIPFLAVIVAVGLSYLGEIFLKFNFNPLTAIILGLATIGLRECVDQALQRLGLSQSVLAILRKIGFGTPPPAPVVSVTGSLTSTGNSIPPGATAALALLLLLCSTLHAPAADTNVVVKADNAGLFTANEITIGASTSYNVVKGNAFKQAYSANVSAEAQYWLTRYIGLEADVPFYQSRGVSFSRVDAALLGRLPLGHFAPYAGVGFDYTWSDDRFSPFLRGGIEFRPVRHVVTFVDYQQNFTSFQRIPEGSGTVRGGFRFVL